MIFEAEKNWNIDLSLSYLIGDRWRDIETAKNTDIRTVLIDYHYDEKKVKADFECNNFEEAVNFILKIY
jgi:D-glycero-D-manno-heptose 1,7-bisphosphate phosphatase